MPWWGALLIVLGSVFGVSFVLFTLATRRLNKEGEEY